MSIVTALGTCLVLAQTPLKTPDAHRAAARAAGVNHPGLLAALCPEPSAARGARGRGAAAPAAAPTTGRQAAAAAGRQAAAPAPAAAPAARTSPPREQWYARPVKVFDNLYWLGQTEFSAWAITTSEGIIIIDTIFDYSVEAEVVEGLRTLGLNPADIKYVIVSHGHGDHSGGAKLLQDRFKARVLLAGPDWDLLERSTGTKPTRDMVVTDGQRLTLGDTTVTMYITPGHTAGTISVLFPAKDGSATHVAATWGGTLIGGLRSREGFDTYIGSVDRFRDIVTKAGAEVILSNHTNYDGSKTKLPAVQARRPGQPHPYVVGRQGVLDYLTVAGECTRAAYAEYLAQGQ